MIVWIGFSLSLLAMWLLVFAVVLSGVQEARAQKLAYDNLRRNLAAATVPLGGVIAPGSPVAILDAPTAGITQQVVVEGTSGQVLQDGPGHRRDSVLPGQAGVSVLYGRSLTFGGPFAGVGALRPGDTLTATTGQGVFSYVVDGVRRPGDPVPAAVASGGSRLVLVTSEGQGWRRWAPDTLVFVDATLHGQAQPNPSGRPSTVAEAERSMGRDSTSLLLLMLWLQLFVMSTAVLVWTWYRWGRWQTWLVGLPVVLAILWGVAENALAMLPNLS
jgi:sortase A